MKAKKAVKRLDKVVAILSDVIKQYASGDRHLQNVLGVAKASVVRAQTAVNSPASPKTATNAKVSVKQTKQKRAPAKKRRAVAKSKSVQARGKAASAAAGHSWTASSGELANPTAPSEAVEQRSEN
jgi:hypothetical protein